jgi:hypothetical protein
MIAAARRHIGVTFAPVRKAATKWTRRTDRVANRGLERAYPALLRGAHRSVATARRGAAWLGPRVRPIGSRSLRALALLEHWLRRASRGLVRAATAASAVITPRRAIAAVVLAAGACLIASQFIDYRGVEIGQSSYAGLPDVAKPPTVEARSAGEAHAYLLIPLGIAAIALGLLAGRRDRRRLGLLVSVLGLIAIVVILLVDLPQGLDAGAQTSRFAGAAAVLDDGFYAELAAASGLVLAGLLYYARPCRIRISSSGRAASARRRRPRRRASSRARVARSV